MMEQEEFIREVAPLRESLLVYAGRYMQGDGAEAEDVVQEALLKLWYIRRDLRRYGSVRALAFRITKHLCLNRLKVCERYGGEPDERMADGEALSPYRMLERKDQVEHLTRMIDRLPAMQQAILRMKHIEGLEVEEIARITGCAPDAVRASLSRARRKVKELFFKSDGYDSRRI
ncbi:MAG: RNA polymerase sigma factor [Tannerellaceae bacterium]|jgi:RNA polymerase sigma-70 factor (ECF subfamily)|nr:RNA polymerase sigma factor [Tannerellaceae bacterium]